jgi:hypothetical protein
LPVQEGVTVLIDQRINSCQAFQKSKCQHQKQMEKVYLFPQIVPSEELLEYQKICLTCHLADRRRQERAIQNERRNSKDRRNGQERRQTVNSRFQPIIAGQKGLERKSSAGWRIIDLRSGEDRRSGKDRRQSKSSIEEQATNTL